MKASVVIPVWNGRPYLSDCLDALLAQEGLEIEVIVVDNASRDGSGDFVAQRYPLVRLIRSPSNRGFAGGCNLGLRKATGDVVVLLNQDTVVRPGWLQALAAALQRPEVGIAGCKLLYPDGRTIQHGGGWIEWPLGLAHHYGRGEPDQGQWDEPREVEYVTGAAMAFRREVLERVGWLDEGFWPGYFEDADFCFRAREKGFRVWYAPEAVAVHFETVSTTDPKGRSLVYQRGRLRFVLKHLPPQRFLDEFVPAERAYQPNALRGYESVALQTAYLEAMATAPILLCERWGADREVVGAVLLALHELYTQAWEEERKKDREAAAAASSASSADPSSGRMFPPLREYEFRSTVPLLGPWIARFRSLWYSVAARWAVRDLIQQQEAINRSLERKLDVLLEVQTLLARRVADLSLQILSEGGRDDGDPFGPD